MGSSKKSILIALTNQAFLQSQISWANAIDKQNGWRSVSFWVFPDHTPEKIFSERHIKIPELINRKSAYNPLFLRIFSLFNRIFERVPYFRFFHVICQTIFEILYSKVLIQEIREYIRYNNVKIVLLPDSSPAYYAPEFTKAAKQEGALVFTNPLDRDNPESYALIYRTDEALYSKGVDGWVISKYYSRWQMKYKNRYFFRIKSSKIFSQELQKIASPRPWNTIGFLEDKVVASNEVQRNFYLETGVPSEHIVVVGSPQLDYLAALKNDSDNQNNLLKSFSFQSEKKFLLCALPQTHWIAGRPEAEFQDHQQMIDAWVSCLLSQNTFNVIISLHPSMRYENFAYLNGPTLQVSRLSTLELLPICSIFVANISSTIPLALALGKPVINYDVYRYSMELSHLKFEDSKGTITVYNKEDFSRVILKLSSDSNYFNTLKEKQEESSWKWGVLDGKSTNRFLNVIDKLT